MLIHLEVDNFTLDLDSILQALAKLDFAQVEELVKSKRRRPYEDSNIILLAVSHLTRVSVPEYLPHSVCEFVVGGPLIFGKIEYRYKLVVGKNEFTTSIYEARIEFQIPRNLRVESDRESISVKIEDLFDMLAFEGFL